MPHKIFVGFTTRRVEGFTPDVESLSPPSNYKNPDAINRWREERAKGLEEEFLRQPYTATFDEVVMIDLGHQRVKRWSYRDPGGDKPAVSVSIRNYLLSAYPGAWPNTTHPAFGEPTAVFVGFNTRLFLKILGIECSLPCNQPEAEDADNDKDNAELNILPLSAWYSNTDHRDIENAVMPPDYKALDWSVVLKARGLDELFSEWYGPGKDAEEDAKLAVELAAQLGMLADSK